jgi:tRNA(fMet)-specific endonuclease VapC
MRDDSGELALIVADTDVLIDFLRGRGAAERVALELKQGLATTVISAFELWAGSIGSTKREKAVAVLLDALAIITLDASAAKQAAALRHSLQKKGRTIGMADSLIAGICIDRSAILLTRNTKHFGDIPRLSLGTLSDEG